MKKPHLKIKKQLSVILIAVAAIAVLLGIYFFIFYQLPTPYSLENYKTVPLSTNILDRNGKSLYQIYRDQNRTPIKLDNIPKYMSQATISIEDKDFYKHGGISLFSGVLRALKEDLFGGKVQGGSTLTQQLVKGALLSSERTVQRKLKEIVLAVWTEKVFTKNQILEMYLNQVAYGGNSYGIQSAAKTYFGVDAKNLTLPQAALLAGLPQAPSVYSPFVNPQYAVDRRNEVLLQMKDQKYITDSQYLAAKKTPLNVISPQTTINAPHFVFKVKQELEDMFGPELVEEGGLKVTTTLDLDFQKQAEKILKDSIEKQKYLNVNNGAVLATRPPTGEIIVMIGSVDYFAQPYGAFNVTTALRQPGSSIKPLNYAVGIDQKIVTPATVFFDQDTCFPGGQGKKYCPVNYDGKYHGPVQLRFALANSYNVPAVRMLELNGLDRFLASAEAFGITSLKDTDKYGLSLTLGAGEVPMVQMSQAFGTFANRGISKPLVDILEVDDKNGKVLYKFNDPNFVQNLQVPLRNPNFLLIDGKKVVSPETAFIISHILSDNYARSATFGTGSALVIPGKTVSVKTGTTENKKDNLTTGYTANFLVDVWVGNNDGSAMNPAVESGETGAAPIWNGVMRALLKNQPDQRLIRPANVVDRNVCALTGSVTTKNDDPSKGCPTRFEYFIKGTDSTYPTSMDTESIPVNKDTGKQTTADDPNMEMKDKQVLKNSQGLMCIDCTH